MIKLTFHGAAKEVGRSCIELNTKGSRILLDSGLKITENGIKYPIDLKNLTDVDCVLLSHAHIDHSGALPYFSKLGLQSQIYCTELTKKIAMELLKDSHKVELLENFVPRYSHSDINKVQHLMKVVQINKEYNLKDINFKFLPAGHISGACSILVRMGNKKLLYSGDFNTIDIQSMVPAENASEKVDYLIIETTYGDRSHPQRKEVEKEFIADVKEVLNNNGCVIIAGFAVGRIQEMIMLLADENLGVPIYVAGMGNKINKIILESAKNLNDIKNYKEFKKDLKKIQIVNRASKPEELLQKKCIILSTSGMLTGGPVMSFIKHIWNDTKSAIFLTGFQMTGTNGRLLVDTGKLFLAGVEVMVKCKYKKFDFSAHAGLKELKEFVRKVKPKKTILNHGDPEAIENFASWMRENKFDVSIPSLGETIELD